jgi:diaminohydroxyphosphoribosylaminopyrimidine deaminase/5-amino-6-(5-phosphoribosylamino)uracil reductase
MDSVFLALAAAEAEKYIGATSPNPPVGACLVQDGRVLSVGAHVRAGTDHAEIVAIKRAIEAHGEKAIEGATLYLTLEPCNHFGKTPPCTQSILEAGLKRVVFTTTDPNPSVRGGGANELRNAGVEVVEFEQSSLAQNLNAPFLKWISSRKPWVVLKLAYRITSEGELTMLPDAGTKTFTSDQSLKLAHIERKKCDAILTGMETVFRDHPLFTVRHVPDHIGKRRWLAVMTRSGRGLPSDWVERQTKLGFEVHAFSDLQNTLAELGKQGAMRVMVEAGPTLSNAINDLDLWDERLTFIQNKGNEDLVVREFACSQES